MKSILQNEKRCFLCGSYEWLEFHHVWGGANRKVSDKNGFAVYLCHYCHNEPPRGVHHNKENMRKLQAICQAEFERQGHSREEFVRLIGRNYLD